MKKTAIIMALCLLMAPLAAMADEALYKAKCVACHGADGKKSAKADLTSAAVQDKTDDALVQFLTTHGMHKSKVASADQAKSVVKHLRTFKK
ncbi:MAG TPA: c-type cytochrome [Thermoanaerobaculia bacterium]|nr:c-type cytochrome [Thermoanaerobaculia bacterium]